MSFNKAHKIENCINLSTTKNYPGNKDNYF